MERTLLPGETELQRSSQLLLTTHRLSFNGVGSTSTSTSLLLRSLEWSRVGRSSKPVLAVLAGFATVAGIGTFRLDPVFAIAFWVLALILLAMFFGSRRTTMLFAAGDGRIEVLFAGDTKSRDAARAFANAVDHAALKTHQAPL